MNSRHAEREIDRSVIVSHDLKHPNGSIAHANWGQDQTLHVAVMYSNPCRWETRRRLFNDFERHIKGLPNIKLYVCEIAYGDRPFEVTTRDDEYDLQLRTREMLWHKENALNQTVERFDPGWEYGAYIDGDFHFTRYDIGLQTIHQLQRYDWVQMFSSYCDLNHEHLPMRILQSFAYKFVKGILTDDVIQEYSKLHSYNRKKIGTTGGAWAFRRESFEACGRLLDTCILGSGDWHMAFGLAGFPDVHPNVAELTHCNSKYAESIKTWQTRAAKAVRRNIGYVPCHAIHHFHGSKQLRGYGTRWQILRDHDFDPTKDIFRDSYGLFQLTKDKPAFRDAIRKYFDSRVEDSIQYFDGDTIMGS